MAILRAFVPIVLLFWGAGGCSFGPSLDGRYACGADDACPPGLTCALDRVCRTRPRDASSDASIDGPTSVTDAATQASAPDASTPGDMARHDAARCVPIECANKACGEIDDGCGSTFQCGGCKGSQTCGGKGVPHECG